MAEPSRTQGPEPADERWPPSTQRRRLLIAGAYTAVSAVVLNRIPTTTDTRRPSAHAARSSPVTTEVVAGSKRLAQPPDIAGTAAQPEPDHVYDVISGGRVIDPTPASTASHVGIDGGTITAVSTHGAPRHARRSTPPARWWSPGFIDFLSYEPNTNGAHYKIGDGVTTNLGMHGMQDGVFARRSSPRTPVSARSTSAARSATTGCATRSSASSAGETAEPRPDQPARRHFEQELHNGLARRRLRARVHPRRATSTRCSALAKVAQRYDVPCFFHGRYSSQGPRVPDRPRDHPGRRRRSGAAVHVAHLPSTGGTWDIDVGARARSTRPGPATT